MESKDAVLNNRINELIQNFFKAVSINSAKQILSEVKANLNQLKEYYSQQNNPVMVQLTEARETVWDAYQMYIDAKYYLSETNISDDRGQFAIGFSRGSIFIQSKKGRYLVSPSDLLNRIKLCNEFLKTIRNIKEVPAKTYESVRKTYRLISQVSEENVKNNIGLFLRNWVKLLIQWKIEILALGVITTVLKGDPAEFKKLVEKHKELIAQLDALFQGQRYQKTNILDNNTYQETRSVLQSKYYDLTQRRGGILGGGGTRDILLFLHNAQNIQDISIPSFISEIDFKELFPKEIEGEDPHRLT